MNNLSREGILVNQHTNIKVVDRVNTSEEKIVSLQSILIRNGEIIGVTGKDQDNVIREYLRGYYFIYHA